MAMTAKCRQCGGYFIPRKDEDPEICYRCNKYNIDCNAAIDELIRNDHTRHCAARMVWGDGECECGVMFQKKEVGHKNNKQRKQDCHM